MMEGGRPGETRVRNRLQNLVIGIVLIALALLVGAVIVFHHFGPDLAVTPLPDMEIKSHDPDEPTLQVTVGGDERAEELQKEARRVLSIDHARELVEQQTGVMTPSERLSLDSQRRFQHVVKKGETLRGLAREYLGDERLWETILEANRSLTRPEDLAEGQTIVIPLKDAK
jgi:nucleoid-associated protein YgaU